MNHKTITIAEIGENHIGNMDIARNLIQEAVNAGADYVKFQSYKPENFKKNDPEYKWFKKIFLSNENHFSLKKYSESLGIKFLSAPFSVERAKFLCEDLGLKEIKIASPMMLNFSLLDYVNNQADTIFLSTGMASIPEIKKALSHLPKIKNCYILHCITQYPCQEREANLSVIKVLEKEFPEYKIGYSDHTVGCLAPTVAVALGAKVIEKHFTFDKEAKEGTDHILSANPEDLKEMIKNIKRTENLMGNSLKTPTEGEMKIINFVRNRFI